MFYIGPLPITNSLLLSLVGDSLVLLIFLIAARRLKHHSRSLFVYGVSWVYEMLFETCVKVLGSREKAKALSPLAITIFVAVLVNNWLEILPIVGPITYNHLPLFRGFASDMNSTFALAIISMATVQIWAIKTHGFGGNLRRYLHNPFKNPLHAFEGFLEIIAEFSRLVALSLRLYGNILGGEVLLIVLYYVSSFGAPLVLPTFMALEMFVGAVQAYVFFMLTLAFISIATTDSDEHGEPVSQQEDTKAAVQIISPDSR